jgi:D-alanyl-D-alanine-carboxypeptidase/D-alanyl-D-alanine-endopeptidase
MPPSYRHLLLLASLFLATTVHGQAVPPLASADALGRDLFVRSGSTGMVMVVVRGDEVFSRGYGETAIGSGQAPTADSLLRLCSLSKIFATDLLIKLAADKTVRLDTTLQRLAHGTVPSRDGRAITLADLATHTAGLPREVGRAPHGAAHFTFPDYRYRWAWLPKQHLKTTPGTAALYSNIGFDLLGDALAAATHESYAHLFAERTAQPLGLHETGFDPNPEQCARLLQGAHDEGACTSTEESAASAGVYSTGRDMTVWLKYVLGTGAPAIPAQNAAAQAVYLDPANLASVSGLDHAGEPSGIGLGWIHTQPLGDPSEIVEKTGGGAGFLTYIVINHARKTAIFIAATDGRVETHLNLFRAANDVLLNLAGLPPLPPEPPRALHRAVAAGRAPHRTGPARRGHAAGLKPRAQAKKPRGRRNAPAT